MGGSCAQGTARCQPGTTSPLGLGMGERNIALLLQEKRQNRPHRELGVGGGGKRVAGRGREEAGSARRLGKDTAWGFCSCRAAVSLSLSLWKARGVAKDPSSLAREPRRIRIGLMGPPRLPLCRQTCLESARDAPSGAARGSRGTAGWVAWETG